MEDQVIDTTQPFNVFDVDGDATVSARRRYGYVTVSCGGNTFGSSVSAAWLNPTDARKLAGFLMIAADQCDAMYGPTTEGHRDLRPTIITPPEMQPSDDLGWYLIECRECNYIERAHGAAIAIVLAFEHDETHRPRTTEGDA